MDYVLTITCLIVAGIILAVSLNLVQGYGGVVSVSHGASMGVGAYVAGVLSTNYGLDTSWTMIVGALVAGAVGWLFMSVAARLDPDDFILASFAFQMVVIDLIAQWTPVTGGNQGLFGIERPEYFGVKLTNLPLFTAFVLGVGLASWLVHAHISRAGYGLILRGIRESSRSVEAAGKDAFHTQVVTFAVANGFAGLAGGIVATTIGLITPGDFNIQRSILVVAFLLVGGMGNMTGAVLGTVALMALPEMVKQFVTVPNQWQGPGQQIVYGVIIVLFVWFRPQGIIPERPVYLVHRQLRRLRRGGSGGVKEARAA